MVALSNLVPETAVIPLGYRHVTRRGADLDRSMDRGRDLRPEHRLFLTPSDAGKKHVERGGDLVVLWLGQADNTT